MAKAPLFHKAHHEIIAAMLTKYDSLPVRRIMESDTVVYECWLQDDRESFVRLHTIEQVIAWVDLKLLLGLQLHQQLVIVPHLKSEYSE